MDQAEFKAASERIFANAEKFYLSLDQDQRSFFRETMNSRIAAVAESEIARSDD